jgi:hypothetical protein
MTDPNRSNSLTDLAARISAEHRASTAAMQRGVEHAIRAGELLIEAKRQLKHGHWLPWLIKHCEMSERTAQLYMRLARAKPELEANPQRVADMTVRGAVAVLAPPPPPSDEGQAIADRIKAADVAVAEATQEYMLDLRAFAQEIATLTEQERGEIIKKEFGKREHHVRYLWRRWLKVDDDAISDATRQILREIELLP